MSKIYVDIEDVKEKRKICQKIEEMNLAFLNDPDTFIRYRKPHCKLRKHSKLHDKTFKRPSVSPNRFKRGN